MRIVPAALAALFLCAGAACANPVAARDETNPCLLSAGRTIPERMIACDETISSQTTLAVHIDARLERARIYMSVGDRRRALADCSEVVRRAPAYARGYAALAEARAFGGNIPGAIEEYGRAIKLEPANAKFWAGRCWMLARLGDLAAARADCERGLALQPDAYYAFGARAFMHLLRHDYQAAMADFDAELGLTASNAAARAYALYGRGLAKRLGGHADRGRGDLAEAQLIDPTIADQFKSWGFTA